MKHTYSCARPRTRLGMSALIASALAAVAGLPSTIAIAQTAAPVPYCTPSSPGQTPTYCIGWSAIVSGGIRRAHNSCYLVSGTVGQLAPQPGYAYQAPGGSVSTNYGVFSGFWAAAQTSRLDEIFFNGFEGCGS